MNAREGELPRDPDRVGWAHPDQPAPSGSASRLAKPVPLADHERRVPFDLDRLSSSALELLFARLLEATGLERQPRAASREHRFDEWTSKDGSERWVVELKNRLGPTRLRDAALELAGARQLLTANHALLLTTDTITDDKVLKVLADLQVELWDRAVLDRQLAEHPAVIADFEAERQRGAGPRVAGRLAIHALSLRNFRGIEALDLDIERAGPVLVLHGSNGAGKSAILSAIAMLLSRLVRQIISPKGKPRPPKPSDLRSGTTEGMLSLRADVEGHEITWSLTLGRGKAHTDLSALAEVTAAIRHALEITPDTSIPLPVHYPVNRAVLDIPKRIRGKHDFSQLGAYEGALGPGWSDFRLFFEWFRQREDLENERRTTEPDHRDRQLEAVRSAIEALLPDVSELRIRRKPLRMTVNKGEQALAIDQLSDGEKCLLAMTGDLARRLAIANPSSAEPHQASAVVLIDEVELHLHPTWQRDVIPRLLETFPGCQFIVTTHSAPVLGRVDRRSVARIDRGRLLVGGPQTRGRDTSAILADEMGLPRHPQEIEQRFQRISQLVDEEQLEAARAEIDTLLAEGFLGEGDAEIVRLRAMIDFLDASPPRQPEERLGRRVRCARAPR